MTPIQPQDVVNGLARYCKSGGFLYEKIPKMVKTLDAQRKKEYDAIVTFL